MPFKSQAQRRKFAQLLVEGKISNETFEEWNRDRPQEAAGARWIEVQLVKGEVAAEAGSEKVAILSLCVERGSRRRPALDRQTPV
jgi:hypothetical protein